MKSNHYLTLSMFLGAIGLLISNLDSWSQALKPSFAGGVLIAAWTVLRAMYQSAPDHESH